MPGARGVVFVEREAFAVSHLVSAIQKGLMAEAAIWSDVTTFNGRPWRGIVDGVIGGIPCQPHSLAGKRGGENDERDLWSDARRIIVQSGAWFVLIENVGGMLSAKPGLDPGALRVRRDLQRLGFDLEGGLFTATEVGDSMERERVFILGVAHANFEQGRRQYEFEGGIREGARQQSDRRGAAVVDAARQRCGKGQPEPIVRGGRDSAAGASDAMADAIGSGHDGRPDGALWRESGRTVAEGSGCDSIGSMDDAANGHRSLHARRRRPGQGTVDLGRASDLGLFPPGPSDLSRWRDILDREPELEPAFRRVADGLASRLDVARVDRLRMLGNGVVSLQAAYALRTLAARLAAGGSVAANRLVRMMG